MNENMGCSESSTQGKNSAAMTIFEKKKGFKLITSIYTLRNKQKNQKKEK